jgi:1-acyl-sn-glycerol-3-phosphate acyltransferase
MIRTKNALMLPSGLVIAFFQEMAAMFCQFYQRIHGGYETTIKLPSKLKHTKRYIVASNHQSLIDPFVIFALLPLRTRLRLLPLKFMTIPKVYHRWYVKPFAYVLGCFPAHIKERMHHTYGVDGTIKLLGYGYNICIFPEGRRTIRAESDPKPGVVKIMAACPEAILLLAHLEWQQISKHRRHLTMVIAPAPPNLDKTSPKAIMDAIYAL